ncbi:MAG: glycerophosphodiester phosphodiesterase [Acidimicrobiia bacterium]|nr:glycerophosphodiester phosphodiesterase [Acidimicrobiia bacterium]
MTPRLPDRTVVLGHRGSSAHARENTIEAFRLAMAQGGAGVELDVRRTADDDLVLHHDPEIAGLGQIVGLSASELPDYVPTLSEALVLLSGAIVNVEIKNSPAEPDWDPHDGVAERVAQLVSGIPGIVVSSFNPATVVAVGDHAPDVARGLLLPPGTVIGDVLAEVAATGAWALHPHWSSIDESVVTQVHDAGLAIIAWTVDNADVIRTLASWGVDAVISNDVAAAVEALS